MYNVFCPSVIYCNNISFTYMQLKYIAMFKPSTAHKLNGNSCPVSIIAPCWNTIWLNFAWSLLIKQKSPLPFLFKLRTLFLQLSIWCYILLSIWHTFSITKLPFFKKKACIACCFYSAWCKINKVFNGLKRMRLNSLFYISVFSRADLIRENI